MSKGSKNRTSDYKRLNSNWDDIEWSSAKKTIEYKNAKKKLGEEKDDTSSN